MSADGTDSLGEFDLIARDYAPLADEGARGLTDDVAVFAGYVVTTDTIACGTHFLPDDPLDTVARKAVRVNVSDLVAKGCRPAAMTLAVAWGQDADAADHALFARGLAADLRRYGIALLGGDTTRLAEGPGPVVTITMWGEPLGSSVPSRSGAALGDLVFVTGTIGDAYLGLRALTDGGEVSSAVAAAYRLPEPPLAAAPLVAAHATASVDVSDGLIADAGHVARASGVRLMLDALPLSDAGIAFAETHSVVPLATGGDDYQALFTAPPAAADALMAAASDADLRLTVIGRCEAGEPGVTLLGPDGMPLAVASPGYRHF